MADVTDPNGVTCDESLVDALGYCNGTCNDQNACGEDANGCLYNYGCGCDNRVDNGCGCDYPDYFDYGCGCFNGFPDALGICFGTCNGTTACGEDGNGCLYDYGCGCGNGYLPEPECGCTSVPDAVGVCGGNCFDPSACGEDWSGCLYPNWQGVCGGCNDDFGCGCGGALPDCSGVCGGNAIPVGDNCISFPDVSKVLAGTVFGISTSPLTGTLQPGTLQPGTPASKVILSSILGVPIL